MTWPTTTQMWQQTGIGRAMEKRTADTVAPGSDIKAAWRCGLCGHARGPRCSHCFLFDWKVCKMKEGSSGT